MGKSFGKLGGTLEKYNASRGFWQGESTAVCVGVSTLVALILLASVMFLQDLSGVNPEGQEVPVAIAAGEK